MIEAIKIRIDRHAKIPITEQITDQLTLLVDTGAVLDGQALPSIRELANFLRVNRNTIVAVYKKLEMRKRIKTIKGSGCFVSSNITNEEITRNNKVRSFVTSVFVKGDALGLSPKEIGNIIYYESQQYISESSILVLVLEAFKGELDFFCSELTNKLNVRVIGKTFSAIHKDEISDDDRQADLAIAPYYFYESAEAILEPLNIPTLCIGAGPALDSFIKISKIPKSKRIAIICTEEHGSKYMVNALTSGGISFKNCQHTWVNSNQFRSIVEWSNVVISSEGAMFKVKNIGGNREIYNYSRILDQSTLSMIKNHIRDLLKSKKERL